MRDGQVYRRCTKCGGKVTERRCARCDNERTTWTYVVDLGPPGAPRDQRKKGGFHTKAEARRAMNELQAAVLAGTLVDPSRLTLGRYLDEWLVATRGKVRPSTWDSYDLHCRRYIVPRLGELPLQQVTRVQVKALFQDLSERGRVRGGSGLSAKSVHNVHLTLRKALADAVEDRLIPRNPAHAAHKLPRDRPEMLTWTAVHLRAFLAYVADDELAALWRLAATTGLRRGEILGLRWSDIDLDQGSVSIQQQRVKGHGTVSYRPPKTAKGRRSVALDGVTVASLRKHRKTQLEQRLMLALPYRDEDVVFSYPDGRPIDPDGLSQRFERHVRESGLPRIRFHDLRHTHATLALRAGVHPKVVQERLGHSSIAITLDTYSHAIPAMQADAAARVAAIVDQ